MSLDEQSEYPSLLRSEKMSFVQLFVPTEVAHDTVLTLGELGNMQFQDLNPDVNPFQRSFVGEIRRFEEMARQIRFFYTQIRQEKEKMDITELEDTAPILTTGPLSPNTIDGLELILKEHEGRLIHMNENYQTLADRKRELTEAISVLRESAVFFEQPSIQTEIRTSLDEGAASAPLLLHQSRDHESQPSDIQLGTNLVIKFVAGVIDRSRVSTLERVLWRLLRGNLYMKHWDVQDPFIDPVTGSGTLKNVFVVFVHGESLMSKVTKVSKSLGAALYPINSDYNERSASLRRLTTQLEDVEVVLGNTVSVRHELLRKIGEKVLRWEDVVKKEKMIYETLNLFNYDVRRRTLLAEGWVPTRDIPTIRMSIRSVSEDFGSPVHPVIHEVHAPKTPPTFFRTNKFTECFQAIMDSYGTAAYGEINPGLFAVVTFPFLFAVMFGDVGHGAIVLAAALWFIRNEKRLAKAKLSELVSPFFDGRYIILLMGLFSLYTGLLYNDIFSRAMHLFESGWTFDSTERGDKALAEPTGYVYPLGVDPAWHGASNRLLFLNSYKMKLSIILGLAHMTFALCLQIPNHLHFNRRADIYLSFLPQLLFLYSLIGYLVFCILFKWSVDWSKSPTPPPSLLNLFIAMFLEPTVTIAETSPLYLYPGQGMVQIFLVCVAGLCVPVIFGGKPIYVWWKRRQSAGRRDGYVSIGQGSGVALGDDEALEYEEEGPIHGPSGDEDNHEDDEHNDNMGEMLIHQTIHTIEFCLNCISHTASYLRLWALSLAHAQLSEVLWAKVLAQYLDPVGVAGWITLAIQAPLWLGANVYILCLMEGLSAFLHALRLHWVEGNSKHFEGGGYPFKPFSFDREE
ncbi:H(+)-transporting V0 sector ATPase subunit a [Marasmius crinis-equi]|uniref:V-type proton ATPase subunit a n=1 Tax=Marasmius crinis-equi TaxID=585013 RepID=A0ABR3FD41_9AGAR